ncbi:MAG: V-type ATPase 116kDa subunit family protein [Rikenellaceae bacterium]
MIKYTFLLHHLQREKLLDALGSTAIIDITVSGWSPDETDKGLVSDVQRASLAVDKLRSFVTANAKSQTPFKSLDIKFSDAENLLDCFYKSSSKLDQLSPMVMKLDREVSDLALWGNFNSDLVSRLEDEGLFLHYYTASDSHFDEKWESEYNLVVCNRDAGLVHFVVVYDSKEPLVLEGATLEKPLQHSVSEKQAELKQLNDDIEYHSSLLLKANDDMTMITSYIAKLKEQLSERKVKQTSKVVADGQLLIIEGWSPINRTDEVDKLFDDNSSIIVVKDRATEGDNPPILLKNNKFARLSELVTRLYSMPQYTELDLTPFFAPFFVFFVGICFGDLGYGIVVFLAAMVAYFKLKDRSMRDIASLVMWCCFAAMVMGSVTGTFFGLELSKMPIFEGFPFLGQMDMFTFALVVGVIQILYAMFIKGFSAVKRKGWKHGVSTIAWALTIIMTAFAYFAKDIGVDFTMSSMLYKVLLAVLLSSYILFINPEKKNLLTNVGGGLWGLYNAITGMLGDTLSYIRLFALGLSGGIIAGVFNDLAIGMSGDIPVLKYVIMAIILLLGHAINMFMAAISSFVHPLRLTLVEFYKCAGFEGGGREYEPFKKSKE